MNRNKTAFTLVEILTVVIILGIMATIVVVQCTDAAEDSMRSNLLLSTQSIRAQLELYRMQHNGKYPTDITAQLTRRTDVDGTVGPGGGYGPYLPIFPANPFSRRPAKAAKTTGLDGEGWSYDSATGVILPHVIGKKHKWTRAELRELAGSIDVETFKLQANER